MFNISTKTSLGDGGTTRLDQEQHGDRRASERRINTYFINSDPHTVISFEHFLNMFHIPSKTGLGCDGTAQVDLGQHGDRRVTERRINTATIDVRLLLKTTKITLSFMGLMFGICESSVSRKLFQIYSTLILLVLFVAFGWDFGMNLNIHILPTIEYTIWKLQAIVHFVIFYIVAFRSAGVSRLFDLWQTYRDKYCIDGGSIKFKSNVCAVATVILFILNAIFNGYHYFSVFTTENTDVHVLILSITSWLVSLYQLFAWVASSSVMFLMASLLADEYKLIYKQIQQACKESPYLLSQRIGDLRRRHWDLMQVVRKADDIFCAQMGVSVVASLVVSSLGLYIIIWENTMQTGVTHEVVRALKVLMALSKLTSDCVAGVIINDAVSKLHPITYTCRCIVICIVVFTLWVHCGFLVKSSIYPDNIQSCSTDTEVIVSVRRRQRCNPKGFLKDHPSVAYMRHWTGSALIHIMACRLIGTKPLPESMLTYCQLDT